MSLNFFKKFFLSGEELQAYRTTCRRCKQTFPEGKLRQGKSGYFCPPCYWVDLAQLILWGIVAAILIFGTAGWLATHQK